MINNYIKRISEECSLYIEIVKQVAQEMYNAKFSRFALCACACACARVRYAKRVKVSICSDHECKILIYPMFVVVRKFTKSKWCVSVILYLVNSAAFCKH